MSLNGVLEGFVKGYKTGVEADASRADAAYRREQIRKSQPAPDLGTEGGPFGPGANIGTGPGGTDSTTTGSTGGKGIRGDDLAWKDATPEQRALLNTIAGPESGGRYNVIYGGGTFSSYADHPRQGVRIRTGPNVNRSSSAAGKYQFLGSTWDEVAKKYGLSDFSPENQDKGAWYLAAEKVGGEDKLNAILKSGDPKQIADLGRRLNSTWTSLPGGIEQGTTSDAFVNAYNKNLKAAPASTGGTATAGAADDKPVLDAGKATEEGDTKPADATMSSQVKVSGGFQPAGTEVAQADYGEEELPEFGTTFARRGGVIPEPKRFADGGNTEPAFGGWGSLLDAGGGSGGNGGSTKANNAAGDFGAGFGSGTYNADTNPVSNWFSSDGTAPGVLKDTGVNAVTAAGQQANAATLTSQKEASDAAAAKQQQDLYNALRQATQPVQDESTVPAATTPAASTGPTASQQAFANYKDAADSFVPIAPTPPPPPVNKGPQYTLIQGQFDPNARLMGNAGQKVALLNPMTGQREMQQKGSRWQKNYAQGGAIPDPSSPPVRQYAGGGLADYWQPRAARATPANHDARFQQLLKEESRGMVSQHGGGDNARDRAARRLSAEEGRPSSTAYTPPGKGGRKSPSGPKIPTKKVDRTTTRSTTKPEIADPHINVTPSSKPEIADPHTNVVPGPKPEIADPHTNVVPSAKPGVYEISPLATMSVSAIPDAPVHAPTKEIPATAEDVPPPPRNPAVLPETAEDPNPRPTRGTSKVPVPAQAAPEQGPPAPPPPAPEVPVLPEPIDLRPAPVSTAPAPAVTPPVDTRPDHSKLINGAMNALAKGHDPKRIGQLLLNAGITQDLWPVELQNAFVGFARGGAVPEPGERGYNEAVGRGETATREPMSPTPQLRNDVATALDSGIKHLKKVFGLGGEGAVPTPDDPAIRQQGVQRMASGEGAATEQEVQQIDQQIDPDNQLDTAGKEMTRLAKTTQWYLDQGRPEDAAASAMSLMQRGAQKFGKIGSLAQAAYNEYQQSHDPQDLAAATKYLEKAYELIPDGANIAISINPDTQMLQVAKTNADGEQEYHDINAAELPGLIQQARDGSFYWQEIFKLADPKGYESKLSGERQAADDLRAQKEWDRQHGITSKEEVDKEERVAARKAEEEAKTAAAELEKEGRTNKEARSRALFEAGIAAAQEDRKAAAKRTTEQINADIDKTMPAFSAAKAAFDADGSPANKAALDKAASDMYRASGFDDTWMINQGVAPGDFTYIGSGPPVPKLAADGKYYIPDPDNPNGAIEVKPKAAAAAPVS